MCNEQTIQQTDFADQLITRQAAIDALHNEIVRRRIDEDTNDDGALDEFDTEAILRRLPPAQPHWIPVTEMMPEKQTEVLVSTFNDVKTAYLNELGWFMDCYGDKVKCVTAWMPLPPRYEEEEE